MTTLAIRLNEKKPERIAEAIAQLQQGRSNAHGTVTLAVSPATTTTVTAPTCAAGSQVNITATSANGANIARTADFYIVAGNESFVIHHGASVNTDMNFTWSING